MIVFPTWRQPHVLAFTLLAALGTGSAIAADLKPGPQGEPTFESTGQFRQQEYRIPFAKDGGGPLLQALLLFPKGDPPYPLAIINHGSPRDSRARAKRPLYPGSSRWFAERGFAVLTLTRRGYGESEGYWAENYGPCRNPNYEYAGTASADDIEAGIRYMRAQAFIDGRRVVLVGQSAGGWGVLATAARNPEGVIAVLNFAGGRGSLKNDEVCDAETLIKTAALWGKTARVPVLWVYAENDKFFGPNVARAMFDSYVGAGGVGEFVAMPPFSHDGHRLFGYGWKIWGPPVDAYLMKFPSLARRPQ
jgi:dienelactone hydrolase